jgi:hypothetical protein
MSFHGKQLATPTTPETLYSYYLRSTTGRTATTFPKNLPKIGHYRYSPMDGLSHGTRVKWTIIKVNLGPWLQRSQMGLYPRKLQSEYEISIGWLLWSFREIDAETLAAGINNDYSFDIYLRWSVVYIACTVQGADALIALHVISNPNCQAAATKVFRQLYDASKLKAFPFGIRMRFIYWTNRR